MDGTLWDAVDNIVIAWNIALQKEGESDISVTRENLLGYMGMTMDHFARAILPHHPLEKAMEIMYALELIENDYLRQHGAVLLGDVEYTFRQLHESGYGVCIVSNCQSGYIEAFLDHYHLESMVDDFECYGDTGKGKAENLKLLIERNNLQKYVYLGDTQGDYEACREVEVPFVWASYGFGRIDAEVSRVDRLEDIMDILKLSKNYKH